MASSLQRPDAKAVKIGPIIWCSERTVACCAFYTRGGGGARSNEVGWSCREDMQWRTKQMSRIVRADIVRQSDCIEEVLHAQG